MEVREGYKKTEVGVIPGDWEVKPLEYLCKPSGLVRGPFGGALKKEYFVKSGYKVYEQRDAIYKNPNIGNYYINKDKFDELARFAVKQGDFIISCSGTIGKIFQIPKNYKQGVINQALLKLTIDSSKAVDKFFEVYFSWDRFQEKIIDSTQGGAMKNLVGMDVFKKTLVAIPPIPEQQAIAAALSDVDAVISSLTKLISKKKNIKQGAMQELLTGKKRLEGFDDKWVEVELGDICEIKKGQMITEKEIEPGKVPVIAGGKQPAYYHRYANRKGKTITISASGANAGYVSFHQEPIFASDCSTIEESKNYDIIFIFSALLLKQPEIYNAQTGGAQPHIHPRDLKPLRVLTPSNVEEQTSIASILSDMDAEIEALEQKLNKYKAIKQGMMHELLTGRIRLI
jgi:type I restriction enzyme S subunit